MTTLLESLRAIIGKAEFYTNYGNDWRWDYGAMCEYFVCAVILVVVIASVFRLLGKLVER